MKRTLVALFCAGLLAASAVSARAQTAISEQEAHAIAVDGYLYLSRWVMWEGRGKKWPTVGPGKECGGGPMTGFRGVREYPPADFKGVVRPNFDTLYSVAWLDLTQEPMVVSAPNTDGRY